MWALLPADTMRLVQSVLSDVLPTNHKAWLSFGIVGTIWVASAAFDAMIEALEIAYDAKEGSSLLEDAASSDRVGGDYRGSGVVCAGGDDRGNSLRCVAG